MIHSVYTHVKRQLSVFILYIQYTNGKTYLPNQRHNARVMNDMAARQEHRGRRADGLQKRK